MTANPTMLSDVFFIAMLTALGWWLEVIDGDDEGWADAIMHPAPFCVSGARALWTARLPSGVVSG